jgi:arylsulfatase A-like enzyme
VFDFLEATGQWSNTLIIFTSDHGEQLGDHYLLGKIGYYDESFRIPLVIADPDAPEQSGRIEAGFTEAVDIMPTILDWMGTPIPPACDGCSLLPLSRGARPADWRRELHYEFDFRDTYFARAESDLGLTMNDSALMVIQDEDFKYVHFTALPPLLFDLRDDPSQLRNLAADSGYAGTVRDYAQRALSWRMRHADRTLTHYRASPLGLQDRSKDPPS